MRHRHWRPDPHPGKASAVVDYEGELAFLIGRLCRHVPKARAAEVIAGYTIFNDVSVTRLASSHADDDDGQVVRHPWPLGPWVDAQTSSATRTACRCARGSDDDLRQDAKTDDLIFDCYAQVEHLSTAFTLEPGDVIATGTPAGVGIAMKPPGLLKAGDVVRIGSGDRRHREPGHRRPAGDRLENLGDRRARQQRVCPRSGSDSTECERSENFMGAFPPCERQLAGTGRGLLDLGQPVDPLDFGHRQRYGAPYGLVEKKD